MYSSDSGISLHREKRGRSCELMFNNKNLVVGARAALPRTPGRKRKGGRRVGYGEDQVETEIKAFQHSWG